MKMSTIFFFFFSFFEKDDFNKILLKFTVLSHYIFARFLAPRHNKEQSMIKPSSQLLMKCLMVSTVLSLPMDRLARAKPIQWRVG